jgi:hypothetical protein
LFIKAISNLVSEAVSKNYFSHRLSNGLDLSSHDAVSECDFSDAFQTAFRCQTWKLFQVAITNNWLNPIYFQTPANIGI